MVNAQKSLVEQLGHSPHARLVILSCDDLGAFHAANVGVYEAINNGVATCASLMVPAPWSRDAINRYNGEDIGVHLTLNAEHANYRWGSITNSSSLSSGEGGFPRTIDDLWGISQDHHVKLSPYQFIQISGVEGSSLEGKATDGDGAKSEVNPQSACAAHRGKVALCLVFLEDSILNLGTWNF